MLPAEMSAGLGGKYKGSPGHPVVPAVPESKLLTGRWGYVKRVQGQPEIPFISQIWDNFSIKIDSDSDKLSPMK